MGGVSSYSSGTKSLYDVTYGGGGKFVVVGANGTIFTSSTGKSWFNRDYDTNDGLLGIAYGNDTFLTVGINGRTLYSTTGGASWTNRIYCGGNKGGVTYGNNLFVMVVQSGNLSTTPDGITWTKRTSNTSRVLN